MAATRHVGMATPAAAPWLPSGYRRTTCSDAAGGRGACIPTVAPDECLVEPSAGQRFRARRRLPRRRRPHRRLLGAAERIFGYRKAEALQLELADLFTADDRRLRLDQQELAAASALGRSEDERWHVRKDGSLSWASGGMAAIRNGTERKRQVLASGSHQLRTFCAWLSSRSSTISSSGPIRARSFSELWQNRMRGSWRRRWDSNPRCAFGTYSLSRGAPSASRSRLRLGNQRLSRLRPCFKQFRRGFAARTGIYPAPGTVPCSTGSGGL